MGPVFMVARGRLHAVGATKEEVVSNERFALFIGHGRVSEKLSRKVPFKLGKHLRKHEEWSKT